MKNQLAALLQRRTGIKQKARTILDAVKAEGRAMTAEESDQVNDFVAKLDRLDDEINAEAERAGGERGMVASRVAINRAREVVGGEDLPRSPASRILLPRGRDYASMFGEPTAAPIDIDEFMRAIHSGTHHPAIMAAVGVEGIGADGGFMVPSEFAARMLDLSLEKEIVRPRARIEPMISDTKMVAGLNTTNHSSSIGGFTVSWIGEATAFTAQKPQTRGIELKARKAGILAECSNELISDGGQTFEQMMLDTIVEGIGFGMDEAFLAGPGTAKPLGAINDPACIEVTKESGQATDTILYENLVKMFSRLHPALVKGSVWVANVGCIPQLLQLQQKIKNVAGSENVGGSWVPIQSDANGGMTILTRPVLFTEKLPVLGDSGDIILANFSQYVIGLRKEISIDKSQHLGFATDTSHYRVIVRVDGMGAWNGPMTPKNGSTLSWCVKLEAR